MRLYEQNARWLKALTAQSTFDVPRQVSEEIGAFGLPRAKRLKPTALIERAQEEFAHAKNELEQKRMKPLLPRGSPS